jgi:hypothetical protein
MNIKLALLLIFFSLPCIASKIYTWVDENGVKHYSENKPEETTNNSSFNEMDINDGATSDSNSSFKDLHSSSVHRANKTSNNQDNCEPEPEKGWDAATLRNIRSYYNTRTSQCREFYKKGSSQIKNCFQEQKEIKENKMNEHRKRTKNRCR